MRVSSRVDYGVRALFDLACNGGSGPVQSRDIARRQGIPEPYLHQLLGALNRGGLVRSTRGPQGGHRLTQSPDAVTLYDIWLVLEGRDRRATDERPPRRDVIADVWDRAQGDFEAQLRAVSLQELMARAGSAPADYSI
jgi:Rrf2 family cysteine metabolism transcriptional repressor